MLKMAWRNLWRNRTRTIVTITAVAITYALYLVMAGIQDYTYGQMEEAAAKAAGGTVLVQGEGFQDSQLNDILIPEAQKTLEAVRGAPGVTNVSPRLVVNGLVSTSASSSAISLQGVDPVAEAKFQDLEPYISSGTFLAGNEEDPIVLGAIIVDELQAEIGDRIIVTATDPTGEMRRALFHLSGVLTTGSRITDSSLAFTTVAAARKALDAPDALSQIGVLGDQPPEVLAQNIGATLPESGIEVLTWAEAMPDLVGFIEMDRAYGDVFAIVLFIVVLFSIMNTFLMVVMERVRELGLLEAIGLSPRRVAALVLAETMYLALVAMSIGLVLGLLGHAAIDHWGIDMAEMYGTTDVDVGGVALTETVIYSTIDVARWVKASINVIFMVLLSAAYPAYKAMRLQPAEAMRFYE